ncbi:hypothetical protein JW935_13590 [candidate division KSB1 bacterium]|nr:hypothetical protein [candidate division KSB1 bacterium]
MVCHHLYEFENHILELNVEETARGKLWTKMQGEWVYFRCYIDKESVMEKIRHSEFLQWSEHLGTHEGSEAGIICIKCQCGVMGLHPKDTTLAPIIKFD